MPSLRRDTATGVAETFSRAPPAVNVARCVIQLSRVTLGMVLTTRQELGIAQLGRSPWKPPEFTPSSASDR